MEQEELENEELEEYDIFEAVPVYDREYTILEYEKAGSYEDFDRTIRAIVLPADKIKEYDKLDMMNPDDEEKQLEMLSLLIFKNYPGKMEWFNNKYDLCDEKKYWNLDLEHYFIHRPCLIIQNKVTGTRYSMPTYQVKLRKDNLDIIEDIENDNLV